jgi:hypothetical protein
MNMQKIGFWTEGASLKRSEFGIDKFGEMLGDKVYFSCGIEGGKK